MNKNFNVIFFSISFLASIMAEVYCLVILKGEPVSTVGMGIVVLILGYLLLDSIREQLTRSSQNIKYLFDQLYREDTDIWNERFTELLNLQKASYIATKKNTALIDEKLQEINTKLENLDMNYSSALRTLTDLQIKSLEGQKNALNIEVNYSKENTKFLVRTIQEELSKVNANEQLSLILSLLQEYHETYGLKEKSELLETSIHKVTGVEKLEDKELPNQTITPLYDDPNKALTPDEIASLFASFGK